MSFHISHIRYPPGTNEWFIDDMLSQMTIHIRTLCEAEHWIYTKTSIIIISTICRQLSSSLKLTEYNKWNEWCFVCDFFLDSCYFSKCTNHNSCTTVFDSVPGNKCKYTNSGFDRDRKLENIYICWLNCGARCLVKTPSTCVSSKSVASRFLLLLLFYWIFSEMDRVNEIRKKNYIWEMKNGKITTTHSVCVLCTVYIVHVVICMQHTKCKMWNVMKTHVILL